MRRKGLFIWAFLVVLVGLSWAGDYPSIKAIPENLRGDHLRVVFSISDNPSEAILPFPNDLVWAIAALKAGVSESYVLLPIEEAGSVEEAALYALIDAAHLKGFSPNMFITIPISKPVRLLNVEGHYKLIDLTDLQTCVASGMRSPACASIDDTGRLVFRQQGYLLRFYPVEPLDPGHRYVFVLLKGIVSEAGQLLEKPWNAYIFDSEKPLYGYAEKIRQQFAILYNVLSKINPLFTRQNVIVLVPFTVASKTFSSAAFALMQQCIEQKGALGKEAVASCVMENFALSPSRYLLSYSDTNGNGILDVGEELYGLVSAVKVIFGAYHRIVSDPATFCRAFVDYGRSTVKSFRVEALGLYAGSILGAYLAGDQRELAAYVQKLMGDPSVRDDVPFAIYGGQYYDGTLLMYQHGLGGSKEIGKSVADVILHKTVLAMDLPWHGERTPKTGPCPQSGACFLTPNIPQDRINYYQAIVDQTILMLVARSGCLDLNGDGLPGDVPSSFYYAGISLGSITGSMFVSLNYADPTGGVFRVDKAVLNVGGANYAALVDEASRGAIQRLICLTLGGGSYGVDCHDEKQVAAFASKARLYMSYDMVLGLLQTLLDPSDPAYVVRAALPQGDVAGKIILQNAFKDTFVPNVSNEALARAFGYSQMHTVLSLADVSTEPGWYMFGNQEHWAVHSFIFTEGLYSLCGLNEAASYQEKLGCLLHIYPELTPYASYIQPDVLEGLMNAAWYQTGGFFW